MEPVRLKWWAVALVLLALAGCHEAVLWEPRPEFVSQVAEQVDVLEFPEGDLPLFEIDGMEVLGDVWYSDYKLVRQMAISRLEEAEQLLRIADLAEIRRVGGHTLDPFASYSVHTCTDCSVGPLSGAGRIFIYGREAGQLVYWETWRWTAKPPSGSDSLEKEEKEDVARILLTP